MIDPITGEQIVDSTSWWSPNSIDRFKNGSEIYTTPSNNSGAFPIFSPNAGGVAQTTPSMIFNSGISAPIPTPTPVQSVAPANTTTSSGAAGSGAGSSYDQNFNNLLNFLRGSSGTTTSGGSRSFVGDKSQDETDYEKALKDRAGITVDEKAVRREMERLFQKEIDALNEVYAVQRAEARQRGLGRLGSDAAIQARRGLLGSSFGAAQTEAVEGVNTKEVRAIDAERSAKIQQVLGEMRKSQVEEIERRRKAATEGADALVDYYKGKLDRTKTATESAIAAMVAVGDVTDDEFQQAADTLGVDVETLKAQYNTASSEAKAQAETAELNKKKIMSELETQAVNRAKTGADMKKPFSAGGYLYEYDVANDKFIQTGKARSTTEDGSTNANYDGKTIPADVKADLMTTIRENPKASISDLIEAFPEVNSKYLQEVFDSVQ